ncbi:hypothetical protein ALC56_05557 [Trachymyrmex septentrionalis]|uniref:Uncharacterized protein n=1 Tax=Trachymyrmex septentrionalis TaxID=34720 RepID=A0A151JYE0_9HYME|nr:hypothetical protein ALC56_05557 [Trachymyrmex septentrionalis]
MNALKRKQQIGQEAVIRLREELNSTRQGPVFLTTVKRCLRDYGLKGCIAAKNKTGKMEEDIALEKHFKPIIYPLKQIVENTVDSSKNLIMTEIFFSGEDEEPKLKRKRPSALYDNLIQASTSVKSVLNQLKTVPSTLNEVSKIIQPRDLSYDHAPSVEEIFEIADEPLVTSIRYLLQTPKG